MVKKKRLDQLLIEKGFFANLSQAKRTIMAGKIYVNELMIDKAGTRVRIDDKIFIKDENLPYVSRGGLKLEKALEVFTINPRGKEAIDIGASTGGFTDCLLQHGIKKVYAIDVSYGQLAWKLRQDKRVKVIERTNFRYLTPKELPIKTPLIVSDVSFISLRLIIPPAIKFMEDNGDLIALIKPQFEVKREQVGKNGVVREKNIHKDIIKEISYFIDKKGLLLMDLNFSPITGASSKNMEFLIHLKNDPDRENNFTLWNKKIDEVVELAHQVLERR